MQKVLEELKELLEKAKMTNKLNPPATPEQIAERERSLGAIIPDEIKQFLMFSNGFEYGWGCVDILPLEEITIIKGWDNTPDGWLDLGSIIGDGAELVGDEHGNLWLSDHESRPMLRRYSIKEWLRDNVIESIYEDIDEDE
ncbi:MAG: SMI1/KNR4 family protein [Ruminococcus sp.]|nr:SMI1/KNR4 family protein [Ruminococcus sp.]